MLDEVAGVAHDAGDQELALGQLHVLPHAPFVVVARVGGLDGVALRAHGEDQVDEIAQRQVVLVRTVIAPPADVEADALGRDVSQRVVQRLDAQRGERAVLGHGHPRMDLPGVGQIGIIDLEQEARRDDRVVFWLHGVRDGREIRLVRRVVLVPEPVLDGAGGDGGQERLRDADAGQRRLEVGDVRAHRRVADVGQRPRADGLASGEVAAAREVFGELGGVPAVDHGQRPLARRERSLVDAAEPLARVRGEVALGLLAIVDHVEPDRGLLAHGRRDGAADVRRQGRAVERTALVLRDQQLAQGIGPGEAAGVGREDPLSAVSHRALPVWCPSKIPEP